MAEVSQIISQSATFIPLVGMALWAAKSIQETTTEGQFFAFPRYNPDGKAGNLLEKFL